MGFELGFDEEEFRVSFLVSCDVTQKAGQRPDLDPTRPDQTRPDQTRTSPDKTGPGQGKTHEARRKKNLGYDLVVEHAPAVPSAHAAQVQKLGKVQEPGIGNLIPLKVCVRRRECHEAGRAEVQNHRGVLHHRQVVHGLKEEKRRKKINTKK